MLKPVLLSCLLICTGGCSVFDSDPEPTGEATELAPSTVQNAETPEEVLFEKAKLYYQGGSYSLALDSFSSLRDGYPGGAYTEFAEIKIADCNFLSQLYEEASKSYEDIIKNRPASSSTPYLLFQAGRSYQLLNQGVGRDREPLEKAITYFDRLIADHPDSIYAQPARHYRDIVFKTLAKHEQEVLDFYKDKGADDAYKARKQEFDKNWSEHLEKKTPEISAKKPEPVRGVPHEAIVERDVTEEIASPAAATLVEESISAGESDTEGETVVNTPVKSSDPVEGFKPLQPAATPEPAPDETNPTLPAEPATLDPEAVRYQIRDVRCETTDGKKVTIHLNRSFEDSQYLTKNQYLLPTNGEITIRFPFTFERDITVNCFETNDLTVKANGEVLIKTESQASLLAVDNPPRLLIFLDQ